MLWDGCCNTVEAPELIVLSTPFFSVTGGEASVLLLVLVSSLWSLVVEVVEVVAADAVSVVVACGEVVVVALGGKK